MKDRIAVSPGTKYGHWVVLSECDPLDGRRRVICRCDCGREKTVYLSNLRSGSSTSCGHTRSNSRRGCTLGPHNDLSGQRYGHLVAVSFISGNLWLWKCDCGRSKRIRASVVKCGKVISCGCVLADAARTRLVDQNVLQHHDGTCISKLRKAVSGTNRKRNNNTGYTGVSKRVYPSGKTVYIARLMLRGKEIQLGTYDTIQDAVAARKNGERMYYAPVIEAYDNHTQADLIDYDPIHDIISDCRSILSAAHIDEEDEE